MITTRYFYCVLLCEKGVVEKHVLHKTEEGRGVGWYEAINQTENNKKGIRRGRKAKKLTLLIIPDS